MRTLLQRRIAVVLSFVALILMFPQQVQATHFRGGFITATITADGTVTVDMETLWRKEYVNRVGSLTILNFSDRSSTGKSISVPSGTTDTSDPSFTKVTQQVTASLSSLGLDQGSYILRYSSCCRIDGLENVGQAFFSLETVVHFNGAVNSAPGISSSVITGVAAGFEYSQNINATDPDSTPLSYTFLDSTDLGPVGQIPGITVDSSGTIKIPAANTANLQVTNTRSQPAGDYVFKVRITDSSGAYTDRDVLLDVLSGTSPPVLASIGNRSVNLGNTLTFTASATDADSGDVVTLFTSTLPANATFTQTSGNPASGTFTFTPNSSQTGTHQINFEARDDGTPTALADDELTTITVLGTNRAPVLNPIGNKSVSAGGTLTFTVSATDPDNDSLTYSASFLPSGATFNTGTQSFSWTPPSSGVFTGIVFKVIDSGGLSDQESISISVGAANQSPQLTAVGKGTRPGLTLSFTVSATDPDTGDTVTLSIGSGGLPTGATFNTSTGVFSWSPTTSRDESVAGQLFTVNFVATDNGSPQLSDTKPVKIGVGDYHSPSTATDPNNSDTDGDGSNDAIEVAAGTNPLDAGSKPTP